MFLATTHDPHSCWEGTFLKAQYHLSRLVFSSSLPVSFPFMLLLLSSIMLELLPPGPKLLQSSRRHFLLERVETSSQLPLPLWLAGFSLAAAFFPSSRAGLLRASPPHPLRSILEDNFASG